MALHWLVALLMIGNLALVWTVNRAPDDFVRPMIDTHKSIGITVLGLAILRLLWRWGHPPPPMPRDTPAAEQRAAHIAHWLLYALIFLLPLSGWMHDSAWKDGPTHPMFLFGLVPWPRIAAIANTPADTKEWLHNVLYLAHKSLAYGLYVLLGLHIVGALKHQFIDRHAEFQRMLPWGRTPE